MRPEHDRDVAIMTELVRFTALSFRTPNPVPFGAAIVHSKSGDLLYRARNAVTRESDPSSHAELRTVRLAAKKLGKPSLAGYTLYSTCEPCAMCMANALWARLDRVVYGATIEGRQSSLQPDSHFGAGGRAAERYGLRCRRRSPPRSLLWSIHRSQNAEGFPSVEHPQGDEKEWENECLTRSRMRSPIGSQIRSGTLPRPAIIERLSKDFYWYSPILQEAIGWQAR